MTWIIMLPLMLVAIAVAVVPMLLGSASEDRLIHGSASRLKPQAEVESYTQEARSTEDERVSV